MCFLNKDSIQIKYAKYSASVGGRKTIINGTYQVYNKNEVAIIFTEPKGVSVSTGRKQLQYSLVAINSVNKDGLTWNDLTAFPKIKTYHFKITERLADNLIVELTLLDNAGEKYSFGKYKFNVENNDK